MVRTVTAALLVLLGAGVAGAAPGRCTVWERLKMLESGFAAPRVEELCGGAPPDRQRRGPATSGGFGQAPPPAPAALLSVPGPPPPLLFVPRPLFPFPVMTRACSSQAGLCPLLTPVPMGAACWCPGPLGPAAGQGR
jgi:hypothetical protein